MLQTIWFFLKLTIIIVGALWLLRLPGNMALSLAGYNLDIQTGLFILGLIISFFVLLLIVQILTSLFSLPTLLRRKKEKRNWQNAYKATTQSITAAAFGDGKTMAKMAQKAYKLLPVKNSLPLFLEAQAAYMSNETKQAHQKFEQLLKDQETMPLGLQGLLRSAMDEKEYKKALYFAEKTFNLYPKQPWVLQSYYHLLIKNFDYAKALQIGKKAIKYKALTKDEYHNDEVAMYFHLAEESDLDNEQRYLEKAISVNPAFTPAVVKLGRFYIRNNKKSKAAQLIRHAWKKEPHKDLAAFWETLAPSIDKPKKYERWFTDLTALNKNHFESHMILAKNYLANDNKDKAIEHIEEAWNTNPSQRCLALRQNIEPAFPSQTTLPDKVWICKETGLIYDQWHPIAQPHNSFNTIVWDTPTTANMMKNQELDNQRSSFFLKAG